MQRADNEWLDKTKVELHLPTGRARIFESFWDRPTEMSYSSGNYSVYLSLIPGSLDGSICFGDRWEAHQFRAAGEMFFVPPRQRVHVRAVSRQPASLIECEFEPEAVRAWFDGDLNWTSARLKAALDITNPGAQRTLWRIADELINPGFASATLCELLAAQLAIDLSRYCNSVNGSSLHGGIAPWRLKRIDDRLATATAPPTLHELAKLCSLSVRQLTRGFRVSRGCSIGDYLEQKQFGHAKQLLLSGSSIKEVASSLGFGSPANFSTAFRRSAGESPRQFRERSLRLNLTA